MSKVLFLKLPVFLLLYLANQKLNAMKNLIIWLSVVILGQFLFVDFSDIKTNSAMQLVITEEQNQSNPSVLSDKDYFEWVDSSKMIFVKGGKYMMGWSHPNEYNVFKSDNPAHEVTLDDFYISDHEVTNKQYCLFLNEKGNQTENEKPWINLTGKLYDISCQIIMNSDKFEVTKEFENYPVVFVNWYGAVAYCKWLSEKTGKVYRLPTEAEWEYAARSMGKEYNYSWGNDKPKGNTGGNIADAANKKAFPNYAMATAEYNDGYVYTSPVSRFNTNELGLFDMTGNVSEWCSDWKDNYSATKQMNPSGPSSGDDKVARGANWNNGLNTASLYLRSGNRPRAYSAMTGFRICMDPK